MLRLSSFFQIFKYAPTCSHPLPSILHQKVKIITTSYGGCFKKKCRPVFFTFQDLQDEVRRESNNLQNLLTQKQEAEEILNGLDEEKAKLEEQLSMIRQKCIEEVDLVSIFTLGVESCIFLIVSLGLLYT